MRDPTRNTIRATERTAALKLLQAFEGRRDLVALAAPQVRREFDENFQDVQDEAERALGRLKTDLVRIDAVNAVYGGVGQASLGHLNDHVHRARAVVDRWIKASTTIIQHTDVANRALQRLNQARTPARKGKDSMKDCVVIETYLDAARALRTGGFASPIVFLSSNVKDYCGETGTSLRADLGAEFGALMMSYAPNAEAAVHHLGMQQINS